MNIHGALVELRIYTMGFVQVDGEYCVEGEVSETLNVLPATGEFSEPHELREVHDHFEMLAEVHNLTCTERPTEGFYEDTDRKQLCVYRILYKMEDGTVRDTAMNVLVAA